MPLKVLILGANGFIGSALTEAILARTDWQVFGMDIADNKLGEVLGDSRFRFVEGDITHGQLSIDVGAYFQGRCQQFRPEQSASHAPTAEPAAAAEYDAGHHG